MNRLIIISAAAFATAAVSVPAVAGLANNPSFSHRIPIHVPSQAKVVQLDDQGKVVGSRHASEHPASTEVTGSRSPEPGDDRGQTTEPGDDRSQTTEPGDDRSQTTEPGDDRSQTTAPGDDGGKTTAPGDDGGKTTAPGDDSGRGGNGGSGGGSGHGG